MKLHPKLPRPRQYTRLLTAACMVGLLSLALMTWSLFDPRAFPIMVAMTLGQILGMLAFGTFLAIVFAELRRTGLRGFSEEPPQGPSVPPPPPPSTTSTSTK